MVMISSVDTAAVPLTEPSQEDGEDAVRDVVRRIVARHPLADTSDIERWVRREFQRHERDRVRLYTRVLVERSVMALLTPGP
jgi:hypothetical protein